MTKIKLLLIEDNDTDALLLVRQLKKEGFEVEHIQVKTRVEMENALAKGGWDLVISDYSLPGFGGNDALQLFKSKELDVPFILVSGTVGEDIAVNIMKGGANDYLMKTHLHRLGPAVKRELEETVIKRDKKQTEKELIEAKLAAEESSRLKSALLQNMSHEFRTPMNGILGFSEILTAELEDPSKKMMAEHILTSGKRLQQTLDAIMLFAQLESGIPLHPVNVNATQMLEKITRGYREMIEKKGLTLEINVPESLFIYSDEHLLTRAFTNMFDNAVKFTSQGGITINAGYDGETRNRLTVQICDTGIGIPEEKHRIIFEEFRQASEGYNRPYEGSGLGLSITRKCVGLLNGTISVNSTPEQGSTFTITIPACAVVTEPKKQDTAENPPPAPLPVPCDAPLILLVEDNDANIELVKMYLRKDYRLDIAKDGETSIELVKKNRYTLILMDINLGPGMDGIDAITEIRKMPNYLTTPIIAVTGYTFRNEKEYIISKGADYYLEKPFMKKAFLELIGEVLQKV